MPKQANRSGRRRPHNIHVWAAADEKAFLSETAEQITKRSGRTMPLHFFVLQAALREAARLHVEWAKEGGAPPGGLAF